MGSSPSRVLAQRCAAHESLLNDNDGAAIVSSRLQDLQVGERAGETPGAILAGVRRRPVISHSDRQRRVRTQPSFVFEAIPTRRCSCLGFLEQRMRGREIAATH